MFAWMRARIEAAAPFPRIGIVRIADALGNRSDMNIAVVNVPAVMTVAAGEFGHVPLSIDGPPCACGANGCWEAYISNIATLSRYFGRSVTNRQPQAFDVADFTIEDLIIRARGNDSKALMALHSTARYMGLGLASIINVVDPSRIYIGGEITEAWDLIEPHVREAIKERTFTSDLGKISIGIVPAIEYPRLRGAAALVTAPALPGRLLIY